VRGLLRAFTALVILGIGFFHVHYALGLFP
jgi:hypothetical protein